MGNDGVNRVVERNFERAKDVYLDKQRQKYKKNLKKISISVPKNKGFESARRAANPSDLQAARSPGMGDTRLLPALKKTSGKNTSIESLKSGDAAGVNYGNGGEAGNGRILERQTSHEDITEEAESSVQQTPRAGRGKGEQDGSNTSEKPGNRGSIANGSVEGSIKSVEKHLGPDSAAKAGATPANTKPEPSGRVAFAGQGLGTQINKAINAMNQSLFEEIRQETEAR